MPTVQVRRAGADDAPAISAVLRAAFAEFEPLYTTGGFNATTPSGDQVARRIEEGLAWVARDGDAVVGTVAAVLRDDGLYVRSMGVLPATRTRGVARQLFARVEQFAEDHGCARLYLSTTPFLAHAIRLYEHLGFHHTDDPPHDLHGTPLLTMVKRMTTDRPSAP